LIESNNHSEAVKSVPLNSSISSGNSQKSKCTKGYVYSPSLSVICKLLEYNPANE
jgi:hypothetical protein